MICLWDTPFPVLSDAFWLDGCAQSFYQTDHSSGGTLMPRRRLCFPILRQYSCESSFEVTGQLGGSVNCVVPSKSGLCDKPQEELVGTIPEGGTPWASPGYGGLQSFTVTRVSDVPRCLAFRDPQFPAHSQIPELEIEYRSQGAYGEVL